MTGRRQAPSFILTAARSGSTLLRGILNAHSAIACPGESNLSQLCAQTLQTWQWLLVDQAPEDRIAIRAKRHARRQVHAIMDVHLERTGKTRWCDKSLSTAIQAEVMRELFPQARFVCLYRHPMDMIFSGIEASRWGYSAFGFTPYVRERPDNVVEALGRYWADHAASVLKFEATHPRRCFRVYYELLVTEPEVTVRSLCDFLGIEFEAAMLLDPFGPATSWSGPGDVKAPFNTEIVTTSLGRGSRVPVEALGSDLRRILNALCTDLGYPPIGERWNRSVSPLVASVRHASCSATADEYIKLVLLPLRSAVRAGAIGASWEAVSVEFEDGALGCCGAWTIDLLNRTVEVGITAHCEVHVVTTMQWLFQWRRSQVDLGVALQNGEFRVFAPRRGPSFQRSEVRDLACCLSGMEISSEDGQRAAVARASVGDGWKDEPLL